MKYVISILFVTILLYAHPTYTGYSGAIGSKGFCATSCHGSSSGGTITINGFPQTYIPLTAYTITVKHTGGSTISNFNISSRKGTTSAVAGTFSAGTNSAIYTVSGYENGVRASINNIDSSVFVWTAPPAGSGVVNLFASGLQGSKSGGCTKISISSAENVTGITALRVQPEDFLLEQNYPNPFNPVTVIRYQVPFNNYVSLKVYDILGNEIETLVQERQDAGVYQVSLNFDKLSSGVYFYSLRINDRVRTKRMVVLK